MTDINDGQQLIINRIAGSRIGKIQESVTLIDLKSSFPNDLFSDEKSDKHGTDIIGTVKESGKTISQISISVKHQKKWSSEFITQLEKNIFQDGTEWGFLVTTTFPSDALNMKIWTTFDTHGRLILLVKPEYVSIAYYAIRMIVIYEFRLLAMVKDSINEYKKSRNGCKIEAVLNYKKKIEEEEKKYD